MFGVELSDEVWGVDVVESNPTIFVVWVSFPVDAVFVFVSIHSVVPDFFDFVLGSVLCAAPTGGGRSCERLGKRVLSFLWYGFRTEV